MTNLTVRIDDDVKRDAEALFNKLGLSMSAAVNVFFRQAICEQSIPFQITLKTPNPETVAAMLEAERIARDPGVKGYTNLDELFKDLKS